MTDKHDQRIDLVDYPAVAPATPQKIIDNLLDACQLIPKAMKDEQRRARIQLASRHADTLIKHRDELETMLSDGDRWLASHPNDDEEAQWLVWEGEYRAIWDALHEGAQIAFGGAPSREQAQLLGIAS